jgi:hypothetical protein
MLRRILGFAVLAFVALFVFKLALGLFGMVVGLAITTAVFAAFGYAIYLGLKVLSPGTAAWIRQTIRGPDRTRGELGPQDR